MKNILLILLISFFSTSAMNDQLGNIYSNLWFNAAMENNEELMEQMRGDHIRPNHVNKQGASPLLLATQEGNLNAVKLLLEYGAYPSQKNNIIQRVSEIIPFTCVHMAAAKGHTKILSIFLSTYKEVYHPDCWTFSPKKRTPLHYAVVNGHLDCIKLLLNPLLNDPNGIFKKDTEGHTPASLATEHKNQAIYACIKENFPQKIVIKHVDECKISSMDSKTVCQSLLKSGADFHVCNIHGQRIPLQKTVEQSSNN